MAKQLCIYRHIHRLGSARPGSARLVPPGSSRLGSAGLGLARLGSPRARARLGPVRLGSARLGLGSARLGWARLGWAIYVNFSRKARERQIKEIMISYTARLEASKNEWRWRGSGGPTPSTCALRGHLSVSRRGRACLSYFQESAWTGILQQISPRCALRCGV